MLSRGYVYRIYESGIQEKDLKRGYTANYCETDEQRAEAEPVGGAPNENHSHRMLDLCDFGICPSMRQATVFLFYQRLPKVKHLVHNHPAGE